MQTRIERTLICTCMYGLLGSNFCEDCASSLAEDAVAAARALRNLLTHMEPQIAAAALADESAWTDVLPQRG